MLARRYEYKAYLEDCDPVFLISNAPRIRLGSSYLESVADASTDELEAPSLVVRPFFENDSLSKEGIWSYFLYDDLDKPEVPEEILRAFRGEESDWKVVRCEIKPDTILFLCVDPQKLKRESVQELFERTGKVAGAAEHDFDFEHGVFWVCLTLGERRCKVGADIFVRGGV